MVAQFVIGIDGGGTSTKSGMIRMEGQNWNLLLDETVFSAFENGATNYHNVGISTAKQRFKEILDHFNWIIHRQSVCETEPHQQGIYSRIASVCLGGAGIDTLQDQLAVEALFREIGYQGKLSIVNDSVVALVGGNKGMEGGIVIAGTGSIAYGMRFNRTVRVGGWGNLLDDEGSGYDLGRRAFKHLLEVYDGRLASKDDDTCGGSDAQLWKVIRHHLGLQCEEDIIQYVYGPQASKSDIAAIAPLVLDLYGRNLTATKIVNQSLSGLIRMVVALSERMELKAFPLTVGGSLLIKSERYRELFIEQVASLLPEITVHLPVESPVAGAIRLALERVSV